MCDLPSVQACFAVNAVVSIVLMCDLPSVQARFAVNAVVSVVLMRDLPSVQARFAVNAVVSVVLMYDLPSVQARFAVNAVVSGDPGRPVRVSRFLAELDAGFRLLNLKNDMLRKRFDTLKYSVQKVEGVVYDLTIRSLVPPGSGDASSKD